jgi:hypothetical protein
MMILESLDHRFDHWIEHRLRASALAAAAPSEACAGWRTDRNLLAGDDSMSTSQSLDRVQIAHTLSTYCNCVDSGDAQGVAGAFMPAAKLELSSGTRRAGREEIHAFYEAVIGSGRPDRQADGSIPLLRHNLTTSRVEFIDEDRAQGWTYFMTLTRFGLDHAGRYIDTFCRHGERWLIEDRRIVVEWYASPSWYEQVRLQSSKA